MIRQSDHRSARFCVFLGVLLLLSSSGCGDSGDRQSLEGTVSLDGEPLAEGSIAFRPQPGTQGPSAGGTITQGHFSIVPEGGAFAGTFRVEITSARKTGRKMKDSFTNEMVDEYEQYLPVRYNNQSELTAKVTEAGPNRFEFTLTSK